MYNTIEITLPYSPVAFVILGYVGFVVIWKLVKSIIQSIPFVG